MKLMSERLTPEQQREMRVRMGGEVQGMAESISGALPRDPDTVISLSEQLAQARNFYQDLPAAVATEFMEKALGLPVKIDVEDRLRGAIVEACTWLQQGAPGCALQVLENALKL